LLFEGAVFNVETSPEIIEYCEILSFGWNTMAAWGKILAIFNKLPLHKLKTPWV